MPPEAVIDPQVAFDAVDRIVDGLVADEPAPGVAYGVVRDGELIHARGIGTAAVGRDAVPTADTVFRIASMTKSFTAATVLSLRDEGSLRLDDPVSVHVPDPRARWPVTIRQLLTMSAGLPTDDPWGDRHQDLDLDRFASLLQEGPSFAWMPGTAFEYSNLGYGILGRVITNVAGLEYRDVVRSRLLTPLGMSATVFEAGEVPWERLAIGYARRGDAFVEQPFDGYGALASMGGLFSTVRDLTKWVDGFARAFTPAEDDHPLARASRLEMQQAHRAIRPELTWTSITEPLIASVAGYGLGLFVRNDLELGAVIGHSGGYPGFGSHMRWHPASGLGVIVLGNRTYFPAMKAAERMLGALVRGGAAPVRRLRPAPALDRARDAVERLLASWDEELARETFSMNVELDEPMDTRRAAAERLREIHGALRRSEEPPVADSPFHLRWWLEGERGRVRVEMTLDPQARPKVQSLVVTSVPEPDPRLRETAERLVASANGGATDPPELVLVRTLYGACTLGPPTVSDEASATFGVTTERGELDLAVAMDVETGELRTVTWTPRSIHPPPVGIEDG